MLASPTVADDLLATLRPPSSPPPGPRSRILPAAAIRSRSGSMTLTVVLCPTRRSDTPTKTAASSGCKPADGRSEERRVGKEWRTRDTRYQEKKQRTKIKQEPQT